MYNSSPGLNSYLDSVERAEQLQNDAEKSFNRLHPEDKIEKFIEWNSIESVCETASLVFAEEFESLDPDYLEYLEMFEDFEGLLNLMKLTVNDIDAFATGLQEKLEDQITAKFEKGEL